MTTATVLSLFTGGSDGSTMRYEKEYTDGANAGLQISQDMLKPVRAITHPSQPHRYLMTTTPRPVLTPPPPLALPVIQQVKNTHAEASNADIWTYAGAKAVEFMGGPKIPHTFCRTDAADDTGCPENGRLPDAAQGAQHLRDVFYRQGFDDKDIVALSGAHTVGRCHLSRSGFDGPWTHTPLNFNNEYFRNLIELEWKLSDRTGPGGNVQYEDVGTGKLMMLPTDMAIKTDPAFVQYARE